MVFEFVRVSRTYPTSGQLLHAIKRNFGGFDSVDPVEIFKKYIPAIENHIQMVLNISDKY